MFKKSKEVVGSQLWFSAVRLGTPSGMLDWVSFCLAETAEILSSAVDRRFPVKSATRLSILRKILRTCPRAFEALSFRFSRSSQAAPMMAHNVFDRTVEEGFSCCCRTLGTMYLSIPNVSHTFARSRLLLDQWFRVPMSPIKLRTLSIKM